MRSAGGIVALACASVLGAACSPAVPALECGIDADCGASSYCAAGRCFAGSRTCPLPEAKFSSIDQGFFRVSCGISGAKAINCHSRDGAASSSGLDLSTNSYDNLVGRPAVTTFLPAAASGLPLILVAPGDGSPEGSFLMRKLQLHTAADPTYGAGMPADAPESICDETIDIVRQWIAQGAQRN